MISYLWEGWPQELQKLLALLAVGLVLSVALLGFRLWFDIQAFPRYWRQFRGAPQPQPRLGDDPPLRLPLGVDLAPAEARPGLWLRLVVTLLALVLIPAFAWYFDALTPPDPRAIGFLFWAVMAAALLWYVVVVWTWRVQFDDQGLTVAWLGQPGRRQEWRDLVLMNGDGPFSCMLHFARGPSLMLLRPLVGGERLFQIAEGHLFRGSNARAARG